MSGPELARRLAALAALAVLAACARETPLAPGAAPKLAPGRWAFTGAVGTTVSRGAVCLARFEDTLGRLHAGCRPRTMVRRGEAVIVRDACRNPDGTLVETEVAFTGDYGRAFTADERLVITGPVPPVPPTRLVIRYTRTGSCPGT